MNWRKTSFVFVIFIHIQLLNACAIKDQEPPTAEILLHTRFLVDQFNVTWEIANISKSFADMYANFSLENSSTMWTLSLDNVSGINLTRIDRGESVRCTMQRSLLNSDKKFQIKRSHEFGGYQAYVHLFNFDDVVEYIKIVESRDDVLKLFCQMDILGPRVTTTHATSGILKQFPVLDSFTKTLKKNVVRVF